MLYVQNILIATGTAMPLAVGHLWSLATEEQFYLLWPITLVLALHAKVSRRVLSVGVICLIAFLNVDRVHLLLTSASFSRVYFAPDGHFDVILIGCLAGLWFTSGNAARTLTHPLVRRVFWFVGVSYCRRDADPAVLRDLAHRPRAFASTRYRRRLSDPRRSSPTVSPLAFVLSLPPLVFVGKISYALYLWHPIILCGFHRLPATVEVALAFLAQHSPTTSSSCRSCG